MKKALVAACVLVLGSSAAYADSKVNDADAAKLKAAIADFGCSGGEYEHETEGSGVYEVEDAKCKSGQYDFRLTKDFKVFSITMD